MATLVLSAAGAALGGTVSGSVLGLTGAVIGRAVGATVGRVIDQQLLGQGSEAIERGRIERFRVTGAGEGASIPRLWGRMRLAGHVIWASDFVEDQSVSGGGKGAPARPRVTDYGYSISLALALCEGAIAHVGRIWADGEEVAIEDLTLRVYKGTEDQLPDPAMEAREGAGRVPAHRGLAYVVIEDLDLAPFGNRVPQFTFEVVRHAAPAAPGDAPRLADAVRAVALMPGSGEYALATTELVRKAGFGRFAALNRNAARGPSDITAALAALRDELPAVESVSLIVSWFGDDLRAGACTIRPKVETPDGDAQGMPWRVGELERGAAQVLSQLDGRVVYGGTPTDRSVLQAIAAIRAGGQAVLYYPFVLMEVLPGNGLPDPRGGSEQPALPWRGRITGSVAPGLSGSVDGTAAAEAEVAAFFGTARATDFTAGAGGVAYTGPDEWSYRRFILHQAALCAAAGGVAAFCIGSEMRDLTTLRGPAGFPAVAQLAALAAEVRALLPDAKIGYAADWTEYGGYQPPDGSGDLYFPLDALWADANIDFVGIDNYAPLSDWREGDDHLDARDWEGIHQIPYLQANIEGGEGYDWYYPTPEARDAQRREPITDGARGEPWAFRVKDLRGWWSHYHWARRRSRWASMLAAGEAPRGWDALDGASLAAEDGPAFAGLAAPALVRRGAVGEGRIAHPAAVGVIAGRRYALRIWYRAGTSGEVVATLAHAGGTCRIAGPAGASVIEATGGHDLSALRNIDHGDGRHELQVMLVFAADDPAAGLSVGPGGSDPAGTIVVHGADLVDLDGLVTAWVPGAKPIWFTEFGCAAVDKGTNQPNKFLDPRSTESALPHYSTGRRDDLVLINCVRAVMDYWSDPTNNPVSGVYGGPMIDMGRAHVWAWDARPWPEFPNDRDLWSDGANHARGHWLTGRTAVQPLAAVVAEICAAAGLADIDVSRLFGVVRGFVARDVETARARLETLILAHGIEVVEAGGRIVFRNRTGRVAGDVATASMAEHDGRVGPVLLRAPQAQTAGRVRVRYTEADGRFDARVAEAVFPGEEAASQTGSELPLALTAIEARGIAERWLAEARVARDTIRFALPPSRRDVGAGDVVRDEHGTRWRIDRLEDAGARVIEAVRTEAGLYVPSDTVEAPPPPEAFVPPLPVEPVFLDLPLLTGEEVAHAPHIAVTADPWPGGVAVYDSASDAGYALNRLIEGAAIVGVLETPLPAAAPGLWDRGAPVRVRLVSGTLSSAEGGAVLAGANACAIGAGDPDGWEVLQFARADLVAPDTWALSMRLRGQLGSDWAVPAHWPAGSVFVALDGRLPQLALAPAARGLARHYRVGPASKPVDHASFDHLVRAFDGVGLRPLSPVHLRRRGDAFTWIRRTRIGGDDWSGLDVALGEAREEYLVRIVKDGAVRREAIVTAPAFVYTAAMRAADGIAGAHAVAVAQISDRFGPGPFTRIEIHD